MNKTVVIYTIKIFFNTKNNLFIYLYFLNPLFCFGDFLIFRIFRIWKILNLFLNDDESSVMTNRGMKTEGWDQQKGGTGLLPILTLFNRLLLIYNAGNPWIESLRFLRETHPGFKIYSPVHGTNNPFKFLKNLQSYSWDQRPIQNLQSKSRNQRHVQIFKIFSPVHWTNYPF